MSFPAYWFYKVQNFGDALSPVILEWVTGRQPALRFDPGPLLKAGRQIV